MQENNFCVVFKKSMRKHIFETSNICFFIYKKNIKNMLGYWSMQHAKIFFIFFYQNASITKKKKKQAIHIHSKICKRPKTLIYIKNKFTKAKLYSHKIQSVHLNPNPITKKNNKSVCTRRPQF